MIYFTADHHFGHKNIIKYQDRPFDDVHHMDNILIERWNSRVAPHDIIFHLGDFCFGKPMDAQSYFRRLYGHIKIIPSTDHDNSWNKKFRRFYNTNDIPVEVLPPLYDLKHKDRWITLCHYPIEFWSRRHYGSIHLHGHSHGHSTKIENRYDVGVDVWDFYPVTLEEILKN